MNKKIIDLLSSKDSESFALGLRLFQTEYDWRKVMKNPDYHVDFRPVAEWNSDVLSIFNKFARLNPNHPWGSMIEFNESYGNCYICPQDDFLEFVKFYYTH